MYLTENRLRAIFAGFDGKNIVVIGDVMLDRYLRGDAERVSPEAPVPVVRLENEEFRIGGAANVADNLAVLGAKPILLSVIGDDADGRELIEHSRGLGLDTGSLITDSKRSTTVKTRVLARSQQVCRIDRETTDDITDETLDELLRRFGLISPQPAAVIISDYGKGVVIPRLVEEIVRLCRNIGAFVAVDPKEHHWRYYAGVDLVKPNHHEIARATGIGIESVEFLERAGGKLLETTGAKAALVTRGERGMSLFDSDGGIKHLPTMAREVYDVTGAGDTVIAAVTAAYVGGASIEEAATIANHAAGVVVAEVGTAAASLEDIENSMARERAKAQYD